MADAPKLCLICGTNSNKIAKYDRYNFAPTKKKQGKNQAADESFSDSDEPVNNSKSKKKTPLKPNPRTPTAVSSRQTRNKNPKTFAISLCKVMELPDTPDHPFLQIFSQADYCGSCMTKIKDIHAGQKEMEKIQATLNEARVDIELDLSKHLQTIPFCKNVRRDLAYERYEEDITLILDFHGTEKKAKPNKLEGGAEEPKRKRRQAAIESEAKMKKESDENDVDGSQKEAKVSKQEQDSDFVMEDSMSSEQEMADAENANGSGHVDTEAVAAEEPGNDAKEDGLEPAEIKEEVKPIIVKVKKDPNLKCPHCPIPRYFNIPESLEEHVARVHVDRRRHACDLCDKKCHSLKELQSHKLKVHDVVADNANIGWVCGFCDKDFQQKRYLEDHLDRHEEAKPLNCQFCGRGFTRKESLQKAFQIHKGETVEPCAKCGRNLNLKDYLEHNRRLKEK